MEVSEGRRTHNGDYRWYAGVSPFKEEISKVPTDDDMNIVGSDLRR